jgi:hypothetical protein
VWWSRAWTSDPVAVNRPEAGSKELCAGGFAAAAAYQQHFAVGQQGGGVLCPRRMHASGLDESSRAGVIQLGAGQQCASTIMATCNQDLAVNATAGQIIRPAMCPAWARRPARSLLRPTRSLIFMFPPAGRRLAVAIKPRYRCDYSCVSRLPPTGLRTALSTLRPPGWRGQIAPAQD